MRGEEAVLVRDITYSVDDGEIYRLLGYRKGKETDRGEVRGAVVAMKELSREVIEPRGAYLISSPDDIAGRGPFRKAEKVGLGLCTIGGDLEKKVRELFGEGKYLEGLVLDTIGSVAVDSVADSLNFQICEAGERAGLSRAKRSSPGYGSWPLEDQVLFFDLLPSEELGMRLTPSFMMMPRKSISFAVNLVRGAGEAWESKRCSRCGMLDCPFREHEERGDG